MAFIMRNRPHLKRTARCMLLFMWIMVTSTMLITRTLATETTATHDKSTSTNRSSNDNHDDVASSWQKCTCLGQRATKRKNHHHQRYRNPPPAPPTTTNDHRRENACTNGSCDAHILYLITVHNQRTLDDAVPLFRAIRDARNTIMIHVDTKLSWTIYLESQLYQEIQHCPCGSRVVVESLYDCQWGSWSMNLPTIWAMTRGIASAASSPSSSHNNSSNNNTIDFDIFVNLSGDTMAVLTPNAMARVLGGPLAGINFCTSSACETGLRPTHILEFPPHWHKYSHYDQGTPIMIEYEEYDDTSSASTTTTAAAIITKNTTLHIHFGSQWMTVTRAFCKWLVRSLQRPTSLASRFRDELVERQFLMTDETYFTTLLVHVFPDTLPRIDEPTGNLLGLPYPMTAIRYERMDEHIPTAIHGYYPVDPRYQVPPGSIGLVDEPKVWGPYYLGIYDAWDIRQSGALFCRKVSSMVDENLIKLFPVDHHDQIPPIQWPKYGVAISDLPDWEKDKTRLMQLAMEDEQDMKQKTNDDARDILDQEQPNSNGSNTRNHQQPFPDRDDEIASDL